MMRNYHPDYSDIGISTNRYFVLLYHCRDYPKWKAEAASLLGVGAQQYSTMPHGSEPGDPVGNAVAKRERLVDKCLTIERLADSVDGGIWRAALIQNLCMKIPYRCLDPTILPTSHKHSYSAAKKKFFALLDKAIEDGTRGA